MELGLALDLLMCNYSSALAYSTLCILLIFMHCARLNHSPHADSAPLVGAARGSAQRPKPCTAVASGTAVVHVDLVVDVHACQQPHIYIVAARRGRGAVDYSSRSTAVVG